MQKKNDKILKFSMGLDYFCGLLILSLVAIIFINVVLRYLTGQGIMWTYELCELFIIIWITVLGSAVAVLNRDHIRVEVVDNLLSEKNFRRVELFKNIVIAVFLLLFAYSSILGIQLSQEYTDILRVPRSILPVPLLVGAILMLFFLGYRMVKIDRVLNIDNKSENEEG